MMFSDEAYKLARIAATLWVRGPLYHEPTNAEAAKEALELVDACELALCHARHQALAERRQK